MTVSTPSEELNRSPWLDTTPASDYPSLRGDLTAEVVVVGAGITGLTLARLLCAAGKDVVVLEARQICAGATGFTTAKLSALHSLIYSTLSAKHGPAGAADYAAANLAGIQTLLQLIDNDSIECELEQRDAITYVTDVSRVQAIHDEVRAAQEAGLDARLAQDTALPFPIAAAVELPGQWQVHPRKLALGLAAGAASLGARIFQDSRVTDLDANSRVVSAAEGSVKAQYVVLATHLPFSAHGLYFARAKALRSYAIHVRLDAGANRPSAMLISADEVSRSLRTIADEGLIVGGEGHPVGRASDTQARYLALEDWARQHFPVAAIEHRWSAQDYQTLDLLPYVGKLASGTEGVLTATGYGKWGMSNGAAAALVLRDEILGTDNPYAARFASTRLNAIQSMKNAALDNLAVAQHLVGDRLHALLADHANDLPLGCGALVELEHQTIAAFRDEDGELHGLSPACTHLGCYVAFNDAERSWDCPCHGSRFDLYGAVLEGPALEPLTKLTGTPAEREED